MVIELQDVKHDSPELYHYKMFNSLPQLETAMRGLLITALAVTVGMTPSSTGSAGELLPLIEQKKNGSINWTRGIIQAVGIGRPDETGSIQPLDAKVKAFYHAKKNARRHLIAIVRNIRIDSHRDVADIADTNYSISAKINEMVFKAPEVEKLRKHLADGTVEVHLQIGLYGGLSQLVLPDDIQQIQPVRTVRKVKKPSIRQAGETSAPEIFTGLVIDARGIDLKPVLIPRLLDGNGQEVFGAPYVSREFAVQWGTGGYAVDIKASRNNPRIGKNPLVVKGLRTLDTGHSDIVISNTDAAKLLSSSEHLSFLKECRVLIVVDPPIN
jgi:hypothetical protein